MFCRPLNPATNGTGSTVAAWTVQDFLAMGLQGAAIQVDGNGRNWADARGALLVSLSSLSVVLCFTLWLDSEVLFGTK